MSNGIPTLTDDEIRSNVDAWLEALESDQYEQTVHTLHNPTVDGYCCLGVACKVLGLESEPTSDGETTLYYDLDDKRHEYPVAAALGPVVSQRFGLENGGRFGLGVRVDEADGLIQLNDQFGKSFKEIAAIIRSKPKGLFKEGLY